MRRRTWRAVTYGVPLVFLGLFFAWPVVEMIAKGFVVDGQLDLSGFADVVILGAGRRHPRIEPAASELGARNRFHRRRTADVAHANEQDAASPRGLLLRVFDADGPCHRAFEIFQQLFHLPHVTARGARSR